MTAKPTKRPPMKPVPGWLIVDSIGRRVSQFLFTRPRENRVVAGDIVVPVEIRERAKSQDTRLRRAALRILEEIDDLKNWKSTALSPGGAVYEEFLGALGLNPTKHWSKSDPSWPVQPSAELHVRRETRMLGVGPKPRRAAGKGREK